MDEEAKEFFKRLASFPKEKERKENIIKCLNELLFNFGSFLNDPDAKLERVEMDGKDCMKYTDSNGSHIQSVEGDDAKALFFDTFKMLMKYNREMKDSYNDFIKPYFEEKELGDK